MHCTPNKTQVKHLHFLPSGLKRETMSSVTVPNSAMSCIVDALMRCSIPQIRRVQLYLVGRHANGMCQAWLVTEPFSLGTHDFEGDRSTSSSPVRPFYLWNLIFGFEWASQVLDGTLFGAFSRFCTLAPDVSRMFAASAVTHVQLVLGCEDGTGMRSSWITTSHLRLLPEPTQHGPPLDTSCAPEEETGDVHSVSKSEGSQGKADVEEADAGDTVAEAPRRKKSRKSKKAKREKTKDEADVVQTQDNSDSLQTVTTADQVVTLIHDFRQIMILVSKCVGGLIRVGTKIVARIPREAYVRNNGRGIHIYHMLNFAMDCLASMVVAWQKERMQSFMTSFLYVSSHFLPSSETVVHGEHPRRLYEIVAAIAHDMEDPKSEQAVLWSHFMRRLMQFNTLMTAMKSMMDTYVSLCSVSNTDFVRSAQSIGPMLCAGTRIEESSAEGSGDAYIYYRHLVMCIHQRSRPKFIRSRDPDMVPRDLATNIVPFYTKLAKGEECPQEPDDEQVPDDDGIQNEDRAVEEADLPPDVGMCSTREVTQEIIRTHGLLRFAVSLFVAAGDHYKKKCGKILWSKLCMRSRSYTALQSACEERSAARMANLEHIYCAMVASHAFVHIMDVGLLFRRSCVKDDTEHRTFIGTSSDLKISAAVDTCMQLLDVVRAKHCFRGESIVKLSVHLETFASWSGWFCPQVPKIKPEVRPCDENSMMKRASDMMKQENIDMSKDEYRTHHDAVESRLRAIQEVANSCIVSGVRVD